jgi:thioredoxin reductase (NADPH)
MATSFDVIVVGTGPAGLTVALYAARANLKVLALCDPEGSNLERVPRIANLFGFPDGVSGKKLLRLAERHATRFGATLKKEEVLRCRDCSMEKAGSLSRKKFPKAKFTVQTTRAMYGARALVIAAGMQIHSGGIKNEFAFFGKGIGVCVACDGPFYKKKKVMVVGNGNLAASEALELNTFTKEIVVNTHGLKSKIDPSWQRRLAQARIPIINQRVAAVHGSKWLDRVELTSGAQESYQGVFLALGTASAVDFARSLGLVMQGNAIATDPHGRTNIKGIWAAGDVTGAPRQIGKSVGDGVRTGIDLIESLRGGSYVDHREA